MAARSQVAGVEVFQSTDVQLRRAIGLVGIAIEEGWAVTRRLMKDLGYSPRIIQTAFPQFLVHQVMHEIHRLGGTSDDIETLLIPNRRRTSHHVVVRFGGFWTTVSTVQRRTDRPRPARFRADYSYRQMRFVIDKNTNAFNLAPLPDAPQKIHTYIQLLHGPTPENRQMHGFTLIAFTNRFGEYEPNPVDILDFVGLASESPRDVTAEDVQEDLRLKLKKGSAEGACQ